MTETGRPLEAGQTGSIAAGDQCNFCGFGYNPHTRWGHTRAPLPSCKHSNNLAGSLLHHKAACGTRPQATFASSSVIVFSTSWASAPWPPGSDPSSSTTHRLSHTSPYERIESTDCDAAAIVVVVVRGATETSIVTHRRLEAHVAGES